jgi:hypothetical protein
MALDHRTFDHEIRNSSFGEIVQIASADSGLLDVDADIVLVAEAGDITLFEDSLTGRVEDESFVLDAVLGSRNTVLGRNSQYRSWCRSTGLAERKMNSLSGLDLILDSAR